jgi:hypothetical protein
VKHRMQRPHAVALSAVMLLLAGCGVSPQATPSPIPPDVLPEPLVLPSTTESSAEPTAEPTLEEAPESRLRLWFVQSEGLTAVESSLPVGSSPEFVVQALVIGPTSIQQVEGLRTIAGDPLSGRPLAVIIPPDPSATAGPPSEDALVTVQLSPDFSALPPSEQLLLLGQLVLSLTGAGASAVAFVDESGASLAVPLPDGRLLDAPAVAGDFGPLIYRP